MKSKALKLQFISVNEWMKSDDKIFYILIKMIYWFIRISMLFQIKTEHNCNNLQWKFVIIYYEKSNNL